MKPALTSLFLGTILAIMAFLVFSLVYEDISQMSDLKILSVFLTFVLIGTGFSGALIGKIER